MHCTYISNSYTFQMHFEYISTTFQIRFLNDKRLSRCLTFRTTQANVDVTVGGVNCTVHQVTDVQITCETNGAPSGDTKVDVNVANFGSAIQVSCKSCFLSLCIYMCVCLLVFTCRCN